MGTLDLHHKPAKKYAKRFEQRRLSDSADDSTIFLYHARLFADLIHLAGIPLRLAQNNLSGGIIMY